MNYRFSCAIGALVMSLLCTACLFDPQAKEKCTALLEQYCDALSESCEVLSRERCLESIGGAVDCEEAIDIRPQYDVCLEAVVQTEGCEIELPEICNGVILVSGNSDDDESEL